MSYQNIEIPVTDDDDDNDDVMNNNDNDDDDNIDVGDLIDLFVPN